MKRKLLILLVILAAMCGVMAGAAPARALSNEGPDMNDFDGGWGDDQAAYAVTSANYSQVQITQTRVAVYFANNNGAKSVTIIDGDLCVDPIGSAPFSGNNIADRAHFSIPGSGGQFDGEGFWWSVGERATNYYVSSGSFTSSSVNGVFSRASNCYAASKTISFPGSQLAFDANTGYYKGIFTAQFYPGFGEARNHFHIRLSDSDAIVGYDAGLSPTSFVMVRHYPRSGYRTFNLRFAPDCSVTAPTLASGYWHDDDNGDPDINPEPLYIQLRKYRQSDGAYVGTVPLSFSGLSYSFPGPEQNSYYVFSGSSRTVRMDFTAEPGMKYIWRWVDVYYPNGIQFRLPYDSIYWVTGCHLPAADLQPSSTVDKPKITFPETATFQHFVNVNNFTTAAGVSYSIQRYRNGSPVGGAQAGTYSVTGNGQFNVRTNSFTAGAGDAGARICERLTILSGGNISNNPSEACTTVVARPYITATNNDVWAGGRFDHNANGCVGFGPQLSTVQSWTAGGAGAVGEYGVFGLGAITEFGSARNPGGSGLTFANTPGLGLLGAPTRCIANYYSGVGTTGGAWPGVSGIPGGAGARQYFVNGNLTLNAGTLAAGTQAVVVVNGDVTITGNVNYAGSFSGANMPVLWVVARGNIYVREGVNNLSGFYVAQGTAAAPGKIHTCVRNSNTTYNPLTTTACNNALTVYGALLADQVYWQRTAGTAAPGQVYGESVQFDPGLYLASPLGGSGSGPLKLEDLKELPPVY